jgi:hypothetical protein
MQTDAGKLDRTLDGLLELQMPCDYESPRSERRGN